MNRGNIPDDVKRFILVSVQSVPYLEAMLLLHSESKRAWHARQVAERLYLSEKAASELLSELHAAGVLAATEPQSTSYHYCPVSEELHQMITNLANVYSKHLIEITHLIHSKTSKKAQQFADAFKWRKDS